ncbi:molybdenum cofactor guanylyltransferase [Alkaliphilus sp. B6464]|nr:molybdenum cofactor guanylyltransferase [Alkaliphilus sp. B6464]
MIKMDKKRISAVVLAGGNSTRMGQNKALLELGSKTIIERVVEILKTTFEEIIIVTNTPKVYSMLKDVRFVPDCFESREKKSIIGLYTGIFEAENNYAFVVACDMPFLNTDLINYMIDNIGDEDILVPYINGYYQPLHAIYNKNCLRSIRTLIDSKNYKIIDLFNYFDNLKVRKINDEILDRLNITDSCFLNMNTYQEYINIKKTCPSDK